MRPLSELPNTEGFRFVGIRHDGSRVNCRQVREYDGVQLLTGDVADGTRGDTLAGWEPTCACTGVVHRGDCPEAR